LRSPCEARWECSPSPARADHLRRPGSVIEVPQRSSASTHFLRIPKFSACHPQAEKAKVVAVGIALVTRANAFEHPTARLGFLNR
jgi:hypothetical protein